MRQVSRVLPADRVDVGRRVGVVNEVLRLLITHVGEVVDGVTGTLRAVSLPQRCVLPEDAADRLEMGPPWHGVVAHQEEPAGGEPLGGDAEDVGADIRCDPAPNSVERDEVEVAEIVGELGEIGSDDAGVGERTDLDIVGDLGGVLRIDVDAGEGPLGIGGGERRQRPSEPAAELQVAESVSDRRGDDAVEKRDVPHRPRGEVLVEARDVRDVCDIPCRFRGGHSKAPAGRKSDHRRVCPTARRSDHRSGSIDAVMEPCDRAMRRSAPKAWIWSRFSSACSRVVVSTITRPCWSTSLASFQPRSAG